MGFARVAWSCGGGWVGAYISVFWIIPLFREIVELGQEAEVVLVGYSCIKNIFPGKRCLSLTCS
jgi:hypothetical protein